jgi:molybdopterin synthase sulfur carrier subunit
MALSMRVDFYGIYRPLAGGKTVEFELQPTATVRELLDAIVERFPALRAELLDRDGALYPWIPLYVNGRNPRLLANGLDQPLEGTEIISLFSPIASGKINVEETKHLMGG